MDCLINSPWKWKLEDGPTIHIHIHIHIYIWWYVIVLAIQQIEFKCEPSNFVFVCCFRLIFILCKNLDDLGRIAQYYQVNWILLTTTTLAWNNSNYKWFQSFKTLQLQIAISSYCFWNQDYNYVIILQSNIKILRVFLSIDNCNP